jgi:hypothetical protein
MRLVVTDANIIIDLGAGDLLDPMLAVPGIEFHVPDVLFAEELAHRYGDLPGKGLRVTPQPAEATEEVVRLRDVYRRASTNDLFALVLAKRLGCALLTGDRALRGAAASQAIEVHGTVWLVELLLESGVIAVDSAERAYHAMRRDQSRLPWDAVEEQIRRWRAM